jgi:glycine cleavage system H lipoate-binding protein
MVAIFVVMTVMAFVLLDLIVQNIGRSRKAPARNNAVAELDQDLIMPLGYFFHPGHTWAQIEETGAIKIGLDDFAQKILGSIDKIVLPELGEKVREGQPLFSIKQGNRTAPFISPVNGRIWAANTALKPESMKKDPYESGWIVKIEPDSPGDDLGKLEIGTEAVGWMKREIKRFIEFYWGRMPAPPMLGQTAQDGGLPVGGILENADDVTWNCFINEFLHVSHA